MKYFSLSNNSYQVSFKEALFTGLAPDGGLYFPSKVKPLKKSFIDNLKNMSKSEIAYHVISQFVGEDIDKKQLIEIIDHSINFDFPVKKLNEKISVLELFHGPTMAFKDVGARFTSRCISHLNKLEKRVTVLVATSGDTGAAVASGFHGVDGIDVFILYPKDKISKIQEKQISTYSGNIFPIQVEGSFDDCQRMVKEALVDKELVKKFNFTSANSINISRWIPQMLYYFFAYMQTEKLKDDVSFSIPSGNYGNLFSCLLSRKLGLPIKNIISANNINNPVENYILTGEYKPQPSKRTLSNAMDVGSPSNFVRVKELFESNLDKIRQVMYGYSFSDSETVDAIKELIDKYKYTCDPHGAIGYLGAKKHLLNNPQSQIIFLETAHHSKFNEEIKSLINKEFEMPNQLKILEGKVSNSVGVNDFNEFREYVKLTAS